MYLPTPIVMSPVDFFSYLLFSSDYVLISNYLNCIYPSLCKYVSTRVIPIFCSREQNQYLLFLLYGTKWNKCSVEQMGSTRHYNVIIIIIVLWILYKTKWITYSSNFVSNKVCKKCWRQNRPFSVNCCVLPRCIVFEFYRFFLL